MTDLILSSLKAVAGSSLRAFCETFAWIQNKWDAEQEGFRPHVYQSKIIEIEEWCEANDVPCRIVGLKPRRGGSSTVAIAILYHRLKKALRRACILGGSDYQGNMMFKMLRLMARKDRSTKERANVLDKEARFPNGSYCLRVNASGEDAAVSGGFTFLHVTELAKWAQDGVAAAAPVLSAALKCVPFLPGTTIIIESTAEGRGDEFSRIYETGITFEELKAGKVGYVKVFAPWFEFDDAVLEAARMNINSETDLTGEEQELSKQYNLTWQHIAWMRYTIKDQCHESFDEFKRDYPFNDVECFTLSGARVFSITALQQMRAKLTSFPSIPGTLDIRDRIAFEKGDPVAVAFRPCSPEEARLVVIEQPRDGMKYVIWLDTMTGASAATGDDPDNHSCGVWRAGFFHQGVWMPPKAVALLVGDWALYLRSKKFVFIVDPDVLTEMVWRLALFYGNCLVAGEINSDRGTLMSIHQKGGKVYFQKQWNKREQTETNSMGWKTDEHSRNRLIAELGKGIREYANFDPLHGQSKERVEIYLAPVLDECESFVRKSKGREEAMAGKHDDCFVAGTQILTPIGQRPIEAVLVGDLVITRNGPRKVIATRNKIKPVIFNLGLTGTPDHPLITPFGEISLSIADDKTMLYIWNSFARRIEKRSFIEAKNIIAIPTQNADSTEFIFGNMINGKRLLFRFIARCGLTFAGLFQMDLSFITRTMTLCITKAQILSCYLAVSTSLTTCPNPSEELYPPQLEENKRHESRLRCASGVGNFHTKLGLLWHKILRVSSSRSASFSVRVAALGSSQKCEEESTVHEVAKPGSTTGRHTQNCMVYNLQVEGSPEYFANNILVHNCVIGCGIGLCCLDQATTYHRVQGTRIGDPFEDQDENQNKRVRGTYT